MKMALIIGQKKQNGSWIGIGDSDMQKHTRIIKIHIYQKTLILTNTLILHLWGRCEKNVLENEYTVNTIVVHNIFDAPNLAETTFLKNEGWVLTELFKSFYLLKESAGMFGKGGCNVTTNPCAELIKNEDLAKQINHEILPLLFEKIYSILSPKIN